MRSPRPVCFAERNQIELRAVDLEATLSLDHPARNVWAFVEIGSLGAVRRDWHDRRLSGRAAIDSKNLLALRLYATVDGVGSAREIERLTEAHDAYRWMCGGVKVNHHTLSDLRCARIELLDEWLTHSVAVLMEQDLVKLERVAQDGMRVRASAGAASLRRRSTLERCRHAARDRAALERQEHVAHALEQLAQVEEQKKKKPVVKKDHESDEQYKKRSYKQRAATAECVNAIARGRGLTQFVVRGLNKVKAVAFWYAA